MDEKAVRPPYIVMLSDATEPMYSVGSKKCSLYTHESDASCARLNMGSCRSFGSRLVPSSGEHILWVLEMMVAGMCSCQASGLEHRKVKNGSIIGIYFFVQLH